jgi:hypothetical protein
MNKQVFKIHGIKGVSVSLPDGVIPNTGWTATSYKFREDRWYEQCCQVSEGIVEELNKGNLTSAHYGSTRLNRILSNLRESGVTRMVRQ